MKKVTSTPKWLSGFLHFMRVSAAAVFAVYAIGALIGWTLNQTQELSWVAENGIPDTPWHLWIRYLYAAAVLYYFPRWLRFLEQWSGSTSKK
jgi:hypothetical protein